MNDRVEVRARIRRESFQDAYNVKYPIRQDAMDLETKPIIGDGAKIAIRRLRGLQSLSCQRQFGELSWVPCLA
jgi:hypothetical protein